jgi:pyridoxamine 5'-phosphate oxidase
MELSDLSTDPFEQFSRWLSEARSKLSLEYPHAVALATTSAAGRPSVRMVLFKGLNKNGFTFFTNSESRKGGELGANPFVALCFYWEGLGRQVRVEGKAEPLSTADSDAYFHSRPRSSQIGAWASPQSREIASREELEKRVREIEERFPAEIERPPHWGGYRVVPDRLEFWKDGKSRLHDRFAFTLSNDVWQIHRLAP